MKTIEHLLLTAIVLIVAITRADISRELPDEHDNFENLRDKNKVYVDKSNYITKLLKRQNRFICVCRPARFGKSNFLQMLDSYFKGKKSSFKGLAIHANADWQTYPVIHLDFYILNSSTVGDFKSDLSSTLIQTASSYGIELDEKNSPETKLRELIDVLSEREKRPHSVVVLVDEYDYPIRRHADNDNGDEACRIIDFVRKFFGQFKNLVSKVKLLLLTCTTRIPLVDADTGIGLSLLDDITYEPEFSGMIGLTHDELTSHFKSRINAMANARPNETFHSLVQKLRQRYDGYCFSRDTNNSACRLYNFHSVISCLRNQKIDNFWGASVNARYNIIEEFRAGRHVLNVFRNRCISTEFLTEPYDFDETVPMVVCLLLHGCMTFRDYDPQYDEFLIDFPNEEIYETFVDEILKTLPKGRMSTKDILGQCGRIKDAVVKGKTEDLIALFNSIAFCGEEKADDSEYQYIERIARLLQTCDIYCTYDGNYFQHVIIDLVIQMSEVFEYIEYVFEFEWKENAGYAMSKLLNLTRRIPFQETFRFNPVYLMGVNFGGAGGAIDEWIRVTYSQKKCADVKSSHPHYLEMFSYITKTKNCLEDTAPTEETPEPDF